MTHSRDNPDPKNIIPDDQKRKRNASDRAQGLDSYFKAVEATTKPRQAQDSRPGLKIAIPKDPSKPDGDAVENDALLSASELDARGHFVHSPSDIVPTIPAKTKDRNDDPDEDPTDKSYRPPKKSNALDNEAPERVHTSDGEEINSETEYGREVRDRKEKKRKDAKKRKCNAGNQPKGQPAKKRAPVQKTSRIISESESDEGVSMDIDSGSESDGKNALREVEAREEPKAARRGPGNESMQNFHEPTAIVDRAGRKRWEFRCHYFRRTVDGADATFDMEPTLPKLNNLAGHVQECKGAKDDEKKEGPTSEEQINLKRSAAMMEAYLKEGELNPEVVSTYKGFLRIFSAWILDESLPWTTGEAPTLQMLFKYLKITYQLPSDTTVRNQLAHIFQELHGKVVREFVAIKSKIAYATDTWTTPQMVYTFACTVACFINDDWELIERVIDFKPLKDKEHEGLHGGKAFVDGACKIGGFDKCISISTNNASVNDVIVATAARIRLAKYGIPPSTNLHIRCLCHVVNLVVQAILAALSEADDPDEVDYYILNKDQPLHLDIDADPNQMELDSEEFEDDGEGEGEPEEAITLEDEEKLKAMGSLLTKLRYITNKIVSTPQRWKKFRACAISMYYKKNSKHKDRREALAVVRDVRTCWNYTHAMICRAELLKEAIDDWVFKTPGLRALLLTEDEWKTLGEIADVMEPFTEVTLQMSHSKIPTIPFVLPLYLKMEQHLEAVSVSWKHSSKIQHAAKQGLVKLRKYSIPAKQHHSYILATVLHPCLRSHWFSTTVDFDDSAAQEEAIKTAEVIFKYVAESYIEIPTPSPPTTTPKPAMKSITKTPSFLASACSFQRPVTTKPTTVAKRTPQEELADELTHYLNFKAASMEEEDSLSPQEALLNPFLWWKIHAAEFPTLARMARDYLAIPATSVSVERVFSKSRHICSNLRSSLKEKTITMALLTKVWIRNGLFEMMPPKILRRKHGDNGKKEIQ